MTKQTKAQKLADKRINSAYCRHCSGIQINVLDIGKVFKEGQRLIDDGADDAALGAGLRAFTLTIAHND
jgi:alpha-D-ribose 1-methylphosphonate 5-phosphate C-P lyase